MPTAVAVAANPASKPGKPGRWAKVKPWPYAPWYTSMTAWTGKEMLVFGAGNPSPNSPPPFSLRTRAAAGAYDPVHDTWRPITPAPFPLGYSWAVAAGDEVYAAAGRYKGRTYGTEVWKYSPGADRWRRLPDPPAVDGFMRLTAAGDAPAVWHNPLPGSASVHVYDADRDLWRTAPEVPWPGPAEVVGTPGGQLVVFGVVPEPSLSEGTEPGTGGFVEGSSGTHSRPTPPSPSRKPQPAGCWRAAVLDPHGVAWHPLPPSGIAVGSDGLYGFPKWTLAGNRLVRAQRGNIAAKEVAPECVRTDPVPHGGAVDVDTGQWEQLPELPGEEHGSYGGGFAPDEISEGGGDFVLLDGWAYDARRRAWSELPEIRGRELGFQSIAYAWAGDRLLLFANAIHRPLDPEGFRTRVVRAHEGWSWRPYADQGRH